MDRDIGRKIVGNGEPEAAFAIARERVAKILIQKADSIDKLYALHAPEVACIAKGKARTRYELGVETSIAVTNARTGALPVYPWNASVAWPPYGGHPLSGQIEQIERLTGITVERTYVDCGYEGTSMAERPGPTSPTPAASPHLRSSANSDAGMPSSRSSATPSPRVRSNAITLPVPPAMP
ncbi:hypothetical protein [Novosphingobium sp. BL-52-GroH]|uniref:hypothetical protein n=1 Tax=Novosphingobium sp. BL-52-GroH TaxID=3349877 RepID=UPI00384D060C